MVTKFYKTIIISDVHLGIKSSKVKEVIKFLKHHKCETLILNGDIVDGWQLKKSGHWEKIHTKFFKYIMKHVAKRKMKVVYLRGNHDDFLDDILPFTLGNFSIARDYIHESCGKKYYVLHGDIFDSVTTNLQWLAKLGDVSYTFLLWLNRHYNNYRLRRNLPYYSLSQKIKLSVKAAVSFIDDFEKQLCAVAKAKKCDGIITGHIHNPANKYINGIHYLNSGDWVETMSAICETYNGEWKIVLYEDWKKDRERIASFSNLEEERENNFLPQNISIQNI